MTMRSMRRGAELVVFGGVTAAINFGYFVYTGRKLGPLEYADFWAVMSLVFFGTMFLNPLAPFASHVAATAMARGSEGEVAAFRRSIARFTLLQAVPFVVIAALCSRPLASFFHLRSAPVIAIAAAAVAAFAVLSADRGLIQGLARFHEYNINTLVESVVRISAAIALLAYIPSATSAMTAYLAGMIAAVVFLPNPVRGARPSADATPARTFRDELRATGLPMFLLLMSIAVFQNADSLAVKRWLSANDAAAYAAAAALARSFTVVASPLWVLLVPTVAAARNAREGVLTGFRICGAFLALSVVVLAVYATLSVPIYTTLYGPKFVISAPLLVPLSGVVILINLSLLLGQTLVGIGRRRFLGVVAAWAAVEIIALSLYHPSVPKVIALLYALHATLLLFLTGAAVRASRS